MGTSLLWAAGGTGFTFLMTTLGASVVFFFRKEVNASVQRIFLGFAAGDVYKRQVLVYRYMGHTP